MKGQVELRLKRSHINTLEHPRAKPLIPDDRHIRGSRRGHPEHQPVEIAESRFVLTQPALPTIVWIVNPYGKGLRPLRQILSFEDDRREVESRVREVQLRENRFARRVSPIPI